MEDYFEEDRPQGLDAGVYHSTLVAIDDAIVQPFKDPKSGTPDNGERWRFTWDMATPEGDVQLSQLTTRKLNNFPTNAWKILAALGYRGGKVARGDFIGKSCMITLGLKENGWNTFDAFSPIRVRPEPQLKLHVDMPEPPLGDIPDEPEDYESAS
ncbi:MAG TPA: hypothetical protein VMW94_02405 [Actinomycetes bacterium]|nr:hypothetical protein [Actinomycetes bacterium]